MKWMGGWTLADWDAAPAALTDEIVAMILEEQEALRQAYQNARRGRSASRPAFPSRSVAKIESPPAIAASAEKPAGVDPRTGRKVVEVQKPDGTVVSHREIEDGEKLLWQIFGKPKSFQNK